MILSKDVFSQGMRAGVHRMSRPKRIARRLLSAGRSDTAAQMCVLLGAIAAPILSLLGWVGLVMPATTPLHYAAPGLLACAMIGLGTALIGAHSSRGVPQPRGQ
jgi:hypothetical protein